ncbi:MAG: FAD-dependent oxidoreductase [Rhodospirillaceae bacterium]|nr:FAD-dependent oxidoreductase [Rhodospirillaceae bacterium]
MSTKNILVIGGVAAGASFAARARRLDEKAAITIIERGPDVSFANCGLPYHIGGEIPTRDVLAVQTPASLKAQLNIDVRVHCEAESIDRANKRVRVRETKTGQTEWIAYDKLMLAPGAAPFVPPMPGADDPRILTLRNLADMDRIAAAAGAGMRSVVVGAGFIGLEMAEQLRRKDIDVHLVELQTQVLPQLDHKMTLAIESELVRHKVALHLGEQVAQFKGHDKGVSVQLASGKTLDADFVVLSIGVRPETALAQEAGLTLGKRGHIVVDSFMRTSDPDIYAAGDAIETEDRVLGGPTAVPLGGPANRQGRVAADHIFLGAKARPYPGSLGTAILRAFDIAAGITGWSEQRLQREGRPYRSVTVVDSHHAGYFPGAKPIMLKIVWDPETGRLLGAQSTGAEGVDKRLDVMATAITAQMTIEDLCHLELAYAPPFGSAKDIVNLAGFAATNMEDGLISYVYDLPNDGKTQCVDVRGAPLAQAYPVQGAINIPFDGLRANLDKLDKNRPVVTLCTFGKMSYFAARVLLQNGFSVQSFSGGIRANIDPTIPPKLL